MGGGASKKHTAEDKVNPPERFATTEHQDKVDAKDSDPSNAPSHQHEIASRSQTQVIFGNNLEDERQGSFSPQTSADRIEDEYDNRPSHDGDEDDDYDNEENGEEMDDSEEAMQLRMLFAQSAMSMDMDNEDLIFNLMYFGGDTSNFASMMNNAAEETVAAHSAGNTPYKLTPATEMALNKLKIMMVTDSLIKELCLQECSICQEELEVGNEIAEMPGCGHCFHNECVLKWFNLQSWCPVCRTKIMPDENCCGGVGEEEEEGEDYVAAVTKGECLDGNLDVKSNLDALFSNAAEDRMENVD